jgi:uncharacterized protein YciI
MEVQAISPDWIMQKVSTGRPYTIMFLIAAKDAPADEAEAQRLQMGHLAHLFTLEQKGEISVFGPVINDTKLRGVIVFNTTDKERIKGLMVDDPYMLGGYLTYELLDWFSIPGQTLPV